IAQEGGEIAFLLYKDEAPYQSVGTGAGWQLNPMYYYYNIDASASLSNVPAGEYEMVVGIGVSFKSDYPIYVYGQGPKRYQVTVTNDSVFFKEIIKKSEYYGTEYATMQVTDLSAKTGAENLRLVMQTEDFTLTSKGAVKSGTALALDIFPADVNSILGTFVIDAANRQEKGTMSPVYTKLMSIEDGNQVNEVMTEGMVTITQVIGGHYAIDYHLRSATREFVGKCKISSSTVKCYRQVGSTNKTFTLTNEIVTPAPVGMLNDWVSQFPSAEPTNTIIYVQGIVSQIDDIATPEGNASFYISDNGSQTNALYCHPVQWLDNATFVTGVEIALHDTVVIAGNMHYIDLITPAIQGYVMDYKKYVPPMGTGVESPSHAGDTYIYDIMGRLVAVKPANEQDIVELPQAGYYIMRCGDTVEKIMIK
ncbi:MAG: hypothetical protein J6C48_02040, partial [Paludibacteraceae bacterium]|nr:hypothetical protein [Paludibacteraceae bacterium]